ncbi:hypothetical protein AVEN_160367-1 [Araneus ventricosus]|uniref:Uncharacterized protein n=1 Tax=Araneus ventricosus TaxID=182803 RepID=A0A4Y2VUL9_ARAVE|nr:hypothetical protein AVEN_79575-1 [Araneus ventricosus]GBO28091.1 hypothetical protein AVEN_160367-1 [Araneus ventricosus]
MDYLHPGFREIGLHGDLLPRVNVRVVRFLEGPLQLLELGARESGSDSTLFALLGQHAVVARVHFVRQAACKKRGESIHKQLKCEQTHYGVQFIDQ